MRVTFLEASPSLRLALRRWLQARGHEILLGSQDGAIAPNCDVLLVGSGPLDPTTLGEIQSRQLRVIEVPILDPASGGGSIDFALLDRALAGMSPRDQDLALLLDPEDPPLKTTLVTRSPGMRDLIVRIQRLARVDIPVLINGETGTGKELVARALHDLGPRSAQPFVAVHCGAIPEELLESILFGHERGSFTDAVRRHHGHLENAGSGTVLLDEIGEMPVRLQAKLLRVLQQRTFHRVGGSEEIALRARIVSATHRDLSLETETGGFRADLLHRIAGAVLVVPPLRSRRADIPSLTHQFLDSAARSMRLPIRGLTHAALRLLEEQAWPGNVRQLQNVLQRAVVLGESAILDHEQLEEHLDHPAGESAGNDGLDGTLSAWVALRRRAGWGDREIQDELQRRLETALDGPTSAEAESGLPKAEGRG